MNLMIKQKRKASFSTQLVFSAIYQVLIFIVPLITTPYISSIFPADVMGSYSYGYSIVTYFVLAAGFGFSTYGLTAIAKVRDDKTKGNHVFWELFYCSVLFSSLAFAIYMIFVAFNVFYSPAFPKNTKMIYLAFSINVLATLFDVTFLFQGQEHFVSLCIRNIIVKVTGLILVFVLVKTANDYMNYILIVGCSALACAVATFVSIPFLVRKPIKPSIPAMLMHFKHASIFFVPTIATSIYTVISKFTLGIISGNPAANGYFEQADRIINVAVSIINSLNLVLMSRMSYLYAHGMKEEIKRKGDSILSLLSILIFPAFFGLLAINEYLTVGFLSMEYKDSVQLIYILSPKIILIPISGVLGSIYYIPKGQLGARNTYLMAGAVFNLVANIILVKFFAASGAAVASVLTELLVTTLYVNGCRRQLDFRRFLDSAPLCLDAALLMFLLVYFARDYMYKLISSLFSAQSYRLTYILTALVMVLIGCIVYFLLLIIFREKGVLNLIAALKNRWKKRKKRA